MSYALHDSATMLRRNLRHALRYPSMTIATIAGPVLMLLLFDYAFGGALGAGIGGGAASDGGHYIDYLAPGIILMAATSGSVATAVAVCTDMTEGIINRFRTMAISRSSVLTGHVVGSTIQTLVSIVFVIAVALALGFRPTAGPGDWLAAIGLLVLVTFALTWLSAAFGLVTSSPEAATRCAGCSWARSSATAPCSRSAGAPPWRSSATCGRAGRSTARARASRNSHGAFGQRGSGPCFTRLRVLTLAKVSSSSRAVPEAALAVAGA